MLKNVFQIKPQKNILVSSVGIIAAVDVACWPVTGCAVTTDPACTHQPIMACKDNMTLIPSERSHFKQCENKRLLRRIVTDCS